jgi:peptide/nickel transport system substrate-binding protein
LAATEQPRFDGARLRAATLTVLSLLALAGCGGSGSAGTVRSELPPAGGGGTLAYALPSLPSSLDPLTAETRAAQTVTRQVFEPLIERLSGPYVQAAPQAGLALQARPSRDRTTWTVTLRPGVRFQDGTPFNAAAVLANSRRWQTDATGRSLLPHLFAVDAPRPDEVRFLLDRPVPDLVRRLSSPQLAIVSPRALDPQSGQNAGFLPEAAGSGTGAFEAGPSGPGRQLLSRFAGWWGSSMGLGPSLDGVTFVLAPQPSQRLRLLEDGAVQVADPLGPDALRAAGSNPLLDTVGGPLRGIGLEGSVRGINSAGAIPVLSSVWLTRLTG